MNKLFAIILFSCLSQMLSAQAVHVLSGSKSKYLYDRWAVMYGADVSSSINTSRKVMFDKALEPKNESYLQEDLDIKYVLVANSEFANVSTDQETSYQDDFEVLSSSSGGYYQEENEPFLGIFHKTDPFLFQVDHENFKFRVRPLLNVQVGKESGNSENIFQNTRGLEIRGVIDDKLYFFSNILENQARFPNYLMDRISQYQAIPGNGFYKSYNGNLGISLKGYDFLNAQGYLGYNLTKSVALEFGHGKHFIGDGIRSLFLSDYANNYFYLKLNARFWKFNYQTIWAETAPVSSVQNAGDKLLPKKYFATHYLTYMPNKNLEFGLFESVIFSRQDHFEFQYLNPVILYRTVEQGLDSPDNAMLGISARWNFLEQFQVYGQFLLDELKIGELTSDKGWWGNKYGIQAGLKYVNAFGVNNLDLQYEYNRVRPYTYAHRDTVTNFPDQSLANYSHFNQPLAHPLGANFSEHIIDVNYRPIDKVWWKARAYYAKAGLEKNDGNYYGNNILIPSTRRISEYGVDMYQGELTKIYGFDTKLSYELVHGLNVELNYIRRWQKTDAGTETLDYVGGGVTYNLASGFQNY